MVRERFIREGTAVSDDDECTAGMMSVQIHKHVKRENTNA